MFQAIPSNASPKRLVRKYLEFCWSLPYYGSAFFRGQIETPAKSLTSLVINQDTEVIIAINSLGLHVIDPTNVVKNDTTIPSLHVIISPFIRLSCWVSNLRNYLGTTPSLVKRTMKTAYHVCSFNSVLLRMEEEFQRYSRYVTSRHPECSNVKFDLSQVFSRQAVQMDALISAFVDEIKQKAAMYAEDGETLYSEGVRGEGAGEPDECLVPLTTVSRRGIPESCLSNKLTRLTLATFDDEGHCIGHMGSWSFSS